jgi:hypothetical protein
MPSLPRIAIGAALFAASHTAALAASDDLTTFSVGAEYSKGDYGAPQPTDTYYVPFAVKHETGRWILKLTVPYLEITGPGNVIGAGADRVVIGDGNAPRRTASGLGDIVGAVFYNALDDRKAPVGVDVGFKVKFGTANSDKGLGTGENDYAVQADLFKTMGNFTPFGTIGYRVYGDPPGVNFRNVPYGTVGGAYRFSRQTTAGAAYDFRSPVVTGGASVSELTAYVSQRLSESVKLQLYAIKGFSDASPDYGVGLNLSYSR